jgi:methyl-accepting chemotaxis protein
LSQDASRTIADGARAISDLNNQLSTEMLETRRAEKDFQLRREQSYSKHHAELSAAIGRDLQQLKSLARSGDFNDISDKVEIVEKGFAGYGKEFVALEQAEVS